MVSAPEKLPELLQELVSSEVKARFGCPDNVRVVRESSVIASALGLETWDLEDSAAVVVVPTGSTYILEEDYGMVLVFDEISPPFSWDKIPDRNFTSFLFIRGDTTEAPPGPKDAHIRYESIEVFARGAAIFAYELAASAHEARFPPEPVSLLPLAISVVLHDQFSHILIPRFSILPQQAQVVLTSVHDNQPTATIQFREGSRARASDNLLLAELVLDGITVGPAGTVRIQVSVEVDRYFGEIVVEVVEPLSGVRAKHVVARGVLPYGTTGVLEAQEKAEMDHRDEDDRLRQNWNEWIPSVSEVSW